MGPGRTDDRRLLFLAGPPLIRVALAADILLLAEGVLETPADVRRVEPCRALLRKLAEGGVPIALPIPALIQFHQVMIAGMRLDFEDAVARLAEWCMLGEMVAVDSAVLDFALDFASQEKVGLEQAVLLGCAAAAHCDLLITATIPNRLAWRGVSAASPFVPAADPRLEPYLP